MKSVAIKSILAATVFAATAGLSAQAAETQIDEVNVQASQVPTSVVTFKRSELNSAEGRAALEKRIAAAARDVCGPTDYHRAGGLSGVSKSRACFSRAYSEAMSQVGADQVASID